MVPSGQKKRGWEHTTSFKMCFDYSKTEFQYHWIRWGMFGIFDKRAKLRAEHGWKSEDTGWVFLQDGRPSCLSMCYKVAHYLSLSLSLLNALLVYICTYKQMNVLFPLDVSCMQWTHTEFILNSGRDQLFNVLLEKTYADYIHLS